MIHEIRASVKFFRNAAKIFITIENAAGIWYNEDDKQRESEVFLCH